LSPAFCQRGAPLGEAVRHRAPKSGLPRRASAAAGCVRPLAGPARADRYRRDV